MAEPRAERPGLPWAVSTPGGSSRLPSGDGPAGGSVLVPASAAAWLNLLVIPPLLLFVTENEDVSSASVSPHPQRGAVWFLP